MAEELNFQKNTIQLHYVYAHADGLFGLELDKHLANLKRQGIITEWHSTEITPASDGKYVSDKYLATARIILLLISSDFLALDFCYGVEVQRAVKRHHAGEARVIPILLRPSPWGSSELSDLPVLPDNEEPITTWPDEDQAYLNIIEGIQDNTIQLLTSQPPKYRQKQPIELPEALPLEKSRTSPMNLLYIYIKEDQRLCNQLERHLVILQRQGFIDSWASRDLQQLAEENELASFFNTVQMTLLLISPDFLASDHFFDIEMKQLQERHLLGTTIVIHVLLRPISTSGLSDLFPTLPTNGKPVTSWSDSDAAFLDIVQGIRSFIMAPQTPPTPIESEKPTDREEALKHMPPISGPIKIYYSYSRRDETFLESLRTHLAGVRKQANVVEFYDKMVQAGSLWEETLNQELNAAHIILLLISVDYLASDYQTFVELPQVLKRAETREAMIIPIILRSTDWESSLIGHFKPLPTGGKAITLWENQDEAFYDIVQDIRKVVLRLEARLHQETKERLILEGQTYYDAHDYEQALASYERALNLDPKNEFVSSIIGRILLQQERYEDALRIYDNQLRISSAASTYLFKGVALQHLGRWTDALGAYQKARELGFPS